MAIVLMLSWWYSKGWLWILQGVRQRLSQIGSTFAVKVLIQTWFSPWKQIYNPNPTFQTFFRDAIDNAVSRSVGFVVRSSILFAAMMLSILLLLLGFASIVVWPFIPFLVVILPVLSASGVTF